MKAPTTLRHLMPGSVVKDFERGTRRYFPIMGDNPAGIFELQQAAFIITGMVVPKEDLYYAVMFYNVDRYIETIDGALYVRTIVEV